MVFASNIPAAPRLPYAPLHVIPLHDPPPTRPVGRNDRRPMLRCPMKEVDIRLSGGQRYAKFSIRRIRAGKISHDDSDSASFGLSCRTTRDERAACTERPKGLRRVLLYLSGTALRHPAPRWVPSEQERASAVGRSEKCGREPHDSDGAKAPPPAFLRRSQASFGGSAPSPVGESRPESGIFVPVRPREGAKVVYGSQNHYICKT